MNFSKRAVWLAVNSDYGERLVEIAQEHLKLANMLPPSPRPILDAAGVKAYEALRKKTATRIDQLRMERNEIISRFVDQ